MTLAQRLLLVPVLAAVTLAGGLGSAALGSTRADDTLHAKVGPGFTISLTADDGRPVQTLAPGTYTIEVEDEASIHNFHLLGPGVDRSTDVAGTGKTTWTVTLQAGTYTFQCDPHSSTMHGSFKVGSGAAATTTTAASTTPKAPAARVTTLAGSVGPGFTIRLSKAGKRVTSLKAGRYRFVISDRSRIHNFTLERKSGGRFERALTSVSFLGRKSVVITLAPGRWKFYCAPHESTMFGVFRVVR